MTTAGPDDVDIEIPRVQANDVERLAAGFVRALRNASFTIPIGATLTFLEALDVVGIVDRDAVYWAGRATLVHKPEDIPAYDAIFALYFHHDPSGIASRSGDDHTLAVALDDDDAPADEDGEGETEGADEIITVRYTNTETLGSKDFAEYTDAELAEARTVMAKMRLATAHRVSRRRRPARGEIGRLDLGRTVRDALRHGGEPVHRAVTRPGTRPRRLVLLLDVSGSMESYARALIRFLHAAVVGRTKVEAFALGTRLTRLTRELSSRDPDAALQRASEAVDDWSGGTRLGEGLRAFNNEWGVRGMARGAIVVVLSDGWDRGDPEAMATEMERLNRVAHRVVWVNPLKFTPGYAPLAQGMAAAMPFIDEFLEGHCLDSLEVLAEAIAA